MLASVVTPPDVAPPPPPAAEVLSDVLPMSQLAAAREPRRTAGPNQDLNKGKRFDTVIPFQYRLSDSD
ncbi:MAG: hypothetical protein ACMG6S_24245 [Byssovorax sp.]